MMDESKAHSGRSSPTPGPRYNNDNIVALAQQLTAIFSNLAGTPESRVLRVEECLDSLRDTLFAHAEDVLMSDSLHELLLHELDKSFDCCIMKGCKAFEVVFDFRWKDQHEKRSQCLDLLIKQALKSTNKDSCTRILSCVGEVLRENIRNTTDMLSDYLTALIRNLADSKDARSLAATSEVLAKIVEISHVLLKRNPSLMDMISTSCPPLALVKHSIISTDMWYREALTGLLLKMVEFNCFEISTTVRDEMVKLINEYVTSVTEEGPIMGVVSVICGLVALPSFRESCPWDLRGIYDFFTRTEFDRLSTEARCIVAYGMGCICSALFSAESEMRMKLSKRFHRFIYSDEKPVVEAAIRFIREAAVSERGLFFVADTVRAIREGIVRMPTAVPCFFSALTELRERYGDKDMQPIFSLVDEYMAMDQEKVNFGKLNNLLRFMGSKAPLQRSEFSRLRVNVVTGRPEDILIRSLPLLYILNRTNQLSDAVELMFHDSPEVRSAALTAVINLCEIIIRQADQAESAEGTQSLDHQVSNAVERILDVAVADREPDLRLAALQQLSPAFNPYLCLPDNLDALFLTRNDITKETRDEALILLCRLHPYHPAIVHPQLLKTQEYMLRDIAAQESSVSISIYKSQTLKMCADHNSLLLQPHVVEKVVLQRLKQEPLVSKYFTVSLLQLMQSIIDHTGPENHCDAMEFIDPVLSNINNSDTSKRRTAALETLSSFLTTLAVTDNNVLVEIYRAIARVVRWHTEEEEGVLLAAIKVLSTIGATNPMRIRHILKVLGTDEMVDEEEVVSPALAHLKPRLRIHPKMEERYPSAVLYYLVKALQNTMDSRQQVEMLSTVRTMLQEVPANQKALLLTQLLPQLQIWLSDRERAHLYETVLQLMIDLASMLRQLKNIIPSTTGYELLNVARQFCQLPQASQKPLNAYVVQFLDDLAKGLPQQEMRDNRWAVEFIHQRLSQNKSDADLVHRVVKSLESFSEVMHEKDLQLILPHVLQCIEPAQTAPELQRPKMKDINDACFDFLDDIMVKQVMLVHHCCAQIVHTILWYIDLSDNQEEMDIGLHTLAMLIDVVKHPAKRFIMQIERVAERNGYPHGYFVGLVQSAATGPKNRVMLGNTENFSEDLPLCVVSHLPRLSQKEFENEMKHTLHFEETDFQVLETRHPSGQTTIKFQFNKGTNKTACFNLFIRKAQDSTSSLRRNLGIMKVEQSVQTPMPVSRSVIDEVVNSIPSAASKREQSWISWIFNMSIAFVKHSPYAALRKSYCVAERNGDFSRDIFPFAVVSIISHLSLEERKRLMDTFSRAIAQAPNDTKHLLFSLAEFMEADRGEQKAKLIQKLKKDVFVITRASVDQKFGINYDQDPTRGVVVTKLAPGGLGELAGVPVGGQLLAINGNQVRSVSEIRGMIDGLNRIELCVAFVVEQQEKPEPKYLMDIRTLAKVSFDCQAPAKGVYFNEMLFDELRRTKGECDVHEAVTVTERLIDFYGHLNLSMVANGVVRVYAREFENDSIKSSEEASFDEIVTFEQLHNWNEALRRYTQRMCNADGTLDVDSFVGALRCQQSLGNVDVVGEMIDKYWGSLDNRQQKAVIPYRARAAFLMGHWDKFDKMTLDVYLRENFDPVEYCAALFRMGKVDQLYEYIRHVRARNLESFAESFNENYNRAYDSLLELEHLKHFEELVSFTTSNDDRREMLQRLWHKRLSMMASKAAHLFTSVSINALVLEPAEDLDSHILVIRNMIKSQWYTVSAHLLSHILGTSPTMEELCCQRPDLIQAYIRYVYATSSRREAYQHLNEILQTTDVSVDDPETEAWSWCWLLLGEWTIGLFPDRGDEAINQLMKATNLDPDNYAAFHALGILHYDLSRGPNIPQNVKIDHHISSVLALFKSVQLSSDHSNNVMQDVLRILSIWFSYSGVAELNEVVHEGVGLLPCHVWLNVIPQLIARIGITAKFARAILADLLVQVGTAYPESLIYPLTVAEKSPDAIRRRMADVVLAGIRKHNAQLVDEASLISNELVRIAILWPEKWHAAIQQAAYKPDKDQLILDSFKPLYDELDHATTPNERTFEKTFGQTLRRARAALQERATDKAWTFLKQVYAQLSKMIGERRLYMSDVSPTLDSVRDSIVSVPGTFEHGKEIITILKFHPRVYVMPSKQKPRRFGMDASDGNKYRYLLKGHEDMRQDERVMQFIGLIDTIFHTDNATSVIGLTIPCYSVIPLSDNVGIIGWVENTETIYKMLETHRLENGGSIYEEVNLIVKKGGLKNTEEFHQLPKPNRKTLLSYAMDSTPSDELRRIIWERNDTCEQWLEYRQTYGHSLAAMSMVGYVLGLGDRHLNNLMLQDKGLIVHIDFGDCFEVAMHRPLYAEAVPFRLTRLLVCALGITGVDGVFRLTCELAMKNLRKHSENLLSILEAFIYDPLINWRLNVHENDKSQQQDSIAESQHRQMVLDESTQEEEMQLSRSFAKHYLRAQQSGQADTDGDVEETRNQQADLALARVHAKLTGQDFGVVNSSFSLPQYRGGSNRRSLDDPSRNSSFSSVAGLDFDSHSALRDSTVPLLTTYLSIHALNGGVDSLDVPHQVDRLIQEATSLDNLADAYLTGWAPFW